MSTPEGVIKFQLDHVDDDLLNIEVTEIDAWRYLFMQVGIIGQDDDRYDGYGFGNLSQRTSDGFLISGTQTGYMATTKLKDYAEVTGWNSKLNTIVSRGLVKPSSESLTHAVIYEVQNEVTSVFHVHSPDIWNAAAQLKIPITDPDIPYGTPGMAEAVQRCASESGLPGVLSMGGHEDGIVAYGRTASETGLLLVQCLVDAKRALAG